jgi:hypothetical protein
MENENDNENTTENKNDNTKTMDNEEMEIKPPKMNNGGDVIVLLPVRIPLGDFDLLQLPIISPSGLILPRMPRPMPVQQRHQEPQPGQSRQSAELITQKQMGFIQKIVAKDPAARNDLQALGKDLGALTKTEAMKFISAHKSGS